MLTHLFKGKYYHRSKYNHSRNPLVRSSVFIKRWTWDVSHSNVARGWGLHFGKRPGGGCTQSKLNDVLYVLYLIRARFLLLYVWIFLHDKTNFSATIRVGLHFSNIYISFYGKDFSRMTTPSCLQLHKYSIYMCTICDLNCKRLAYKYITAQA